jgi:transcriptional regulator with PAS, ATPase and Fis domain
MHTGETVTRNKSLEEHRPSAEASSVLSHAFPASLKISEDLQLFLDHFGNGVLITDAEGYVVFMNKAYGQFLSLKPAEQIGKHTTEVVENTRMHVVAKTGRPEINDIQVIRGQRIVVQRIPVRKNSKLIAVFGLVMFQCTQDLQTLAEKLSVLESKVKMYEKELISLRATRYTVESIIGESETLARLKKLVFRAAAHNLSVLITGESGCGKELFAQAIHNAGMRRLHPFVRINSSAIPSDLLESELFGYEKGAFTGAKSGGKPGKFQLAHHGTIFFDEVGDFPENMQPKLLRVLEEKEFERVGGTMPIKSDFRLIAATNRNLEHLVESGRFRADLYYRLNVFHLHIPPLRERREDILPQALHFIRQLTDEWNIAEPVLDPETIRILKAYPWPGNTRELRHMLQRTLATLDGERIRPADLPLHLLQKHEVPITRPHLSLEATLMEAEARAIRSALKTNGYNKVQAARMLGIHRTLLYRRMRALGIPCEGDDSKES